MTDTRRIALLVEFDGTQYSGWQHQDNAIAVQNVVEEGLLKLVKKPTVVFSSSRTDAGVHAKGLVCHFDTDSQIPIEKFPIALTTRLPEDVSIVDAKVVPSNFHARFSSRGKQYSYYIYNNYMPSALFHRFSYHEGRTLNLHAMQRAAKIIEGTHDFRCFMAKGAMSKTTIRTLYDVEVTRSSLGLVRIRVRGNAFLYNMVRIIAGTLLYVGLGWISMDTVSTMLETGDRLLAGKTLAAKGLFLDNVYYSEEFNLQWYNKTSPFMDSIFTKE